MAIAVRDLTEVPQWVLGLLQRHLPFSLPVLRRLQFARRFQGGLSPTARILLAYDGDGADDYLIAGAEQPENVTHFAVVFFDPACFPETEGLLYSTLEDAAARDDARPISGPTADCSLPAAEIAVCAEHVFALLRRIRTIEAEYSAGKTRPTSRLPGSAMFGSLHEAVRQLLLQRGVVTRPTGVAPPELGVDFYDKWLFRAGDVAATGRSKGLPEGMRWDAIRDTNDTTLVRSRTAIPRQDATLLLLPSTAIRLDDGTLVAWAFLGLDGSLVSLHCEEPYRGRGLAKMLAAKLMQDHLGDYGSDDGWCSADVSIRNPESQGVCRGLGGKRWWTVSWYVRRGRSRPMWLIPIR